MTYEFLKNFHKRSEIVAIAAFLTERVSRKQRLKEYHLNGSEAVNLVMLVLLFIMGKSLVESGGGVPGECKSPSDRAKKSGTCWIYRCCIVS